MALAPGAVFPPMCRCCATIIAAGDGMILVTGGAGFIGSRLCARLVSLGLEVVSVDDYLEGSRANHVGGVHYIEGHTRQIARLIDRRLDFVFHLGEFSRVEASFAQAKRVQDSNVIGTAAVLQFWIAQRCKLVYAGSSTRFAQDASASPYSISKRNNADQVLALGAAIDLPHAVTYFYNAYGPGERAGATGTLIEIFRQKHEQGEALPVVSPGTQRRNFTHVDDIVDALVLLMRAGVGEFPIGTAENYSVLEVASMFGDPVQMLPKRQGNRRASSLDASAIRSLGWRPRRSLASYISQIKRRVAA
jgi:UDP-glucose 4-epimerase